MRSFQARSGRTGGSDGTSELSKRLLEVAEEFEGMRLSDRERYENAIVTLHDKISSLRTTVELEKTRSSRQQELIDALQQQVHDSHLVETLHSKERLLEQGKLLKEMESLRAEVMALRFQILNTSGPPKLDPENDNPNIIQTSMIKQDGAYCKKLLTAAKKRQHGSCKEAFESRS
mmetsp:Transcript_21285/g.34612  ORF Transcript_21285/g.34612 Transcript_21285/m.34612 type:complete len:175 (+) Transcript_21285:293-817(+)